MRGASDVVEREHRASSRVPEALQKALVGRRILIVEDEFLIAQDLLETFSACGAHVIGPVPDVRTALSLIAAETLDCALLDLDLGGERAYPLAEALEQRRVPFLFSTGYDATSIDARYLDVARVNKPIDALSIAWAVRSRLESASGD